MEIDHLGYHGNTLYSRTTLFKCELKVICSEESSIIIQISKNLESRLVRDIPLYILILYVYLFEPYSIGVMEEILNDLE